MKKVFSELNYFDVMNMSYKDLFKSFIEELRKK